MIEGRAKLQSNANFQRETQTMHDGDDEHNFSWEAKENWIVKIWLVCTLFHLNFHAKNYVVIHNVISGPRTEAQEMFIEEPDRKMSAYGKNKWLLAELPWSRRSKHCLLYNDLGPLTASLTDRHTATFQHMQKWLNFSKFSDCSQFWQEIEVEFMTLVITWFCRRSFISRCKSGRAFFPIHSSLGKRSSLKYF